MEQEMEIKLHGKIQVKQFSTWNDAQTGHFERVNISIIIIKSASTCHFYFLFKGWEAIKGRGRFENQFTFHNQNLTKWFSMSISHHAIPMYHPFQLIFLFQHGKRHPCWHSSHLQRKDPQEHSPWNESCGIIPLLSTQANPNTNPPFILLFLCDL